MAVSSLRARVTRGTHAQRFRRALLFVASLLLLVAATGSFAVVHHDAHVSAVKAAAGRMAVMATVINVPGLVDPGFAPCATVSYCTPDGKEHEATVAMDPTVSPGTRVPLWVTPNGALTSAPSASSPLRRSLPWWVTIAALAAVALIACAVVSARWAARHDEREFEWIVAPLRADEQSWDRADL